MKTLVLCGGRNLRGEETERYHVKSRTNTAIEQISSWIGPSVMEATFVELAERSPAYERNCRKRGEGPTRKVRFTGFEAFRAPGER